MLAQQLLLELSSFQTALERWLTQNDPTKIKEFDQLASHWNEINRNYVALSQMTRYLESWVPQLEAHWNNGNEEDQSAEKLVHALFKKEPIPPSVYETLREDLRPQRVMNRSFLPDDLEDAEGGLINLPIATDITNPSFRAEVEGALITHWNQSSWAKANNISFYISWTFLAPNTAFATGKENLNQHLAHFPPNKAVITTGGLTTYVKDRFLVLGPGAISPRTLAHEMGHLMGFDDCYLRTLTSQWVFGLGVLEWDNPLYPDDLMCDNSVGEPRVEIW